MKVFLLRIKPAFFHAAIDDLRVAGGHPAKEDICELVALISRCADGLRTLSNARKYFNHHILHRGQLFFHGNSVVIREWFTGAFLRREAAKADAGFEL